MFRMKKKMPLFLRVLAGKTYTQVTLAVDEFLYAKSKVAGTTLTFLQNGTEGMEFAVDPLYQIGEDYVLFLKYTKVYCSQCMSSTHAKGILTHLNNHHD